MTTNSPFEYKPADQISTEDSVVENESIEVIPVEETIAVESIEPNAVVETQ